MSLVMIMEAMAGDTIEETCNQMVDIAKTLNVNVRVNFNDVTLMAFRGGCPIALHERFLKEVRSDNKYKSASTGGGGMK